MLRARLIVSFVTALGLTCATALSGQGVEVGGRVGLALSNLANAADYDSELGFNGGLFVGLEFGGTVGFYPELGYVRKGAHTTFFGTSVTPEGNLEETTLTETVRLDYLALYLPVAVHLPVDRGSVRLRLYTGPSAALELGCSAELDQRTETFSPSGERLDVTGVVYEDDCGEQPLGAPGPLFTETTSIDFGLLFGLGIDHRLAGGRFTGEIRYSLGLKDIAESGAGSIRNRTFHFLVGYSRRVGGP